MYIKYLDFGGICNKTLQVLRTILGTTYLTVRRPKGTILGIAIQKEIPILGANRIANDL